MRSRTWLCVCLAAVLTAPPASAQSDEAAADDKQRIELLERQVEVLQLQMKILQNSIAELRQKLAVAESARNGNGGSRDVEIARTDQQRTASRTGRRESNPLLRPEGQRRQPNPLLPPAPPSSAEVLGESRPAAETTTTDDLPPPGRIAPAPQSRAADAGQAPRPADFNSVEEILAALPEDARPDDELGWTTARHAKAIVWLKENVAGKTFRGAAMVFGRSIAGVDRPEPGDADQGSRYRLVIEMQPERFRTDAMTHEGNLLDAEGGPLSVSIAEQLASQVRNALREGQTVTVEGTIDAVLVPRATSTRTQLDVHLKDYKVANLQR